MYECFTKEIIHESIYDICIEIYNDICYHHNNCNDNKDFLKQDLDNFIENRTGNLSCYDINNILISYGIDNAYRHYVDNNYNGLYQVSLYDTKNKFSISKILVNNLIVSAFAIK